MGSFLYLLRVPVSRVAIVVLYMIGGVRPRNVIRRPPRNEGVSGVIVVIPDLWYPPGGSSPILIGVRGRAAGTAYFIPARVGVWLVGGASRGPLGDSGLSPRRRRRRSPWGVGVFRGTFPGTGPIRMCSPDRDLQNVL